MGIKDDADNARKKAYQKVIATKLLDGIDQLSDRASSKRRWIWELLQNAKDVANEKVKVEILLTKESVEFRHNGNPFSIDNITYLIEQVSSKERTTETSETPKATGKFGTGFMTTHLLSRKVHVSGILQYQESDALNYKNFEVELDRSAINLKEMIQKVEAAFSIFEEIDNDDLYPKLEKYKLNDHCDTSFRYVLDEAGFQVAQVGIQDLQNAIAYALAFITSIESVTITDQTQGLTYRYKTLSRRHIGKISMVTIEKNSAESLAQIQTIACLSNENQTITIAAQVQNLGAEVYSLQENINEVPILFCEFPLVGSESFPYPVVINSPLFNPTEPRNGIFLNPDNEQKTPQNKVLLEEATLLYADLLNEVTLNWQSVHLLGKLKNIAKVPENIDLNWYKDKIVNQIVTKLMNSAIVDTVSGHRICLKDSLIPSYKSKADVEHFTTLASSLHANRLPTIGHILDWHDILKSDLGKKFSSNIKYTLEFLLQDIEDQKTLAQLAIHLKKTDSETLDWLNQVIPFASKSQEELLDEYSVIPNQYDQFRRQKELYQDQEIPEALKDVLKILSLDWRNLLIHKEITYKVSKYRDINNAVDDLNKIIRNKEHLALRKAVYTLVSCFPTNTKFIENTHLFSKRDTLWNFARNLDQAVPDKIPLEAWIPGIWKEADLWLLETLVDDIEKLENVETLRQNLNNSTEDSIAWLNQFIGFLTQEDQVKLYLQKTIFPNQEGVFKDKEKLYIDNNIPDELKDVLSALSRGCREKLLDRGIRGFENHHNQLTVKDVSDEIKKRLKNAKNQDDLAEYWSFSLPVYNLVSYFSDSQPNDSEKIAIWEFASQFYPDKIPAQKLLPNLEQFSWDACHEWILNSIAKDIDNLKKLEDFIKYFNSEQNRAIEWLDKFGYFVAKQDDKILDLYAILPNQVGLLMHKKELKKDGEIPEELKEILERLTSDYWNNFLLDKRLKRVEVFFDKEKTKTTEDIAIEIDKAIKEWENNDKTGEPQFTKIITSMIEWSNQQEDHYVKNLFSHFYANKAQLLLKTLNDSEVSSGIFTILNHREKLSVLTELAENSEISEQDLQDFAQNHEEYRAYKELKEQISEQDFQVLNIVAKGVSIAEIDQWVENKNQFDLLKALQDAAEVDDSQGLILALQELGVYEAIANLFGGTRVTSIVSSISQTEWMEVEGTTSYKLNIAEIGREGEAFLYQKLIDKFGKKNVTWLNELRESQSPYDFKVTPNGNPEELYIDAKTTVTKESEADRNAFYVGNSEWKFSETNDCYYIARIFFDRQIQTGTVKFLKFARLLSA